MGKAPVSIASAAKGVGREEKDENLDPATKERGLRSGKARPLGQILESRLIQKRGTQKCGKVRAFKI